MSVGWTTKPWLFWAASASASRSELEPMVRAERLEPNHIGGILTAVILRATNAVAESMNAKIQRIEAMA